jgi:hypothetical protein
MAEAIVSSATATAVKLTGIRKVDLPAGYAVLPETEDFRVKWFGNGYAVEWKRDGLRVSEVVASVYEPEREMRNKYPGLSESIA